MEHSYFEQILLASHALRIKGYVCFIIIKKQSFDKMLRILVIIAFSKMKKNNMILIIEKDIQEKVDL